MDEFHELQLMHTNLSQHVNNMEEMYVVPSIIYYLPNSYGNLKNTLEHKKEDMNLFLLVTCLQIEVSIQEQKGE